MVQVRDKKKAYIEGSGEGAKVFNWKHDLLGIVHWEEDWSCYVIQWLSGAYTSGEFMKNAGSQLLDMEEMECNE